MTHARLGLERACNLFIRRLHVLAVSALRTSLLPSALPPADPAPPSGRPARTRTQGAVNATSTSRPLPVTTFSKLSAPTWTAAGGGGGLMLLLTLDFLCTLRRGRREFKEQPKKRHREEERGGREHQTPQQHIHHTVSQPITPPLAPFLPPTNPPKHPDPSRPDNPPARRRSRGTT